MSANSPTVAAAETVLVAVRAAADWPTAGFGAMETETIAVAAVVVVDGGVAAAAAAAAAVGAIGAVQAAFAQGFEH